jgi:aspartate/methionine/tyrosine aminotransferase
MLVNSPNNPTGAVLREDEIQQLVDIAEQHDLWLISDEIYSRMVWTAGGHISPAALPGGFERTIVVTGWSKSFAMTGWRLGILAGPSRIVKAAAKCQANACSHVPTFLMPAGLAALDESVDEVVDEFCEAYLNRRKLLMQGLEGVPGLKMADPEGAFYAFVDITGTEMDSITFATRALDEARVQLIPGALMEGGEGFVRISYACAEEEIIEGSRRLSEWLSNL